MRRRQRRRGWRLCFETVTIIRLYIILPFVAGDTYLKEPFVDSKGLNIAECIMSICVAYSKNVLTPMKVFGINSRGWQVVSMS